MTDTPQTAALRSIVVDYRLSAAPRKVWRALTDPVLLERWLMPNDISPRVGHRFTFRTDPAPGFDGIVHCEILEVEPLPRLVYSWRGGPVDTTVVWTLAPGDAGGTELRLEHRGFRPEDGMTYDMLGAGWREKAAGPLERVAAGIA